MSITASRPAGSTSANLLDATAATFTARVLPALREHFPQIIDDILVTVTSSVAYGTADPLSDLDVFIIFRRHRDYLRYAGSVDTLIQSMDLNATHADLCDKGLRFELESLHRADLSRLFRFPRSSRAWAEQTEWLLFWGINSIPIHDPGEMHHRLRENCSKYPPDVAQRRFVGAALRTHRWAQTALHRLEQEGLTYPTLRSAMRSASAGLDLTYATAGTIGPHPKWRQALAERLTAHAPRSVQLCELLENAAATLSAGDRSAVPSLMRQLATQARAVLEETAWTTAGEGVPSSVLYEVEAQQPIQVLLPTASLTAEATELLLSRSLHGEHVYLPEELGVAAALGTGGSYDRAQRIADPLRWMNEHAICHRGAALLPDLALGSSQARKRIRYLNFVIWRKLRVIPKAVKRGQLFNARWYTFQVIDHLVELLALAIDAGTPPIEWWSPTTLRGLDANPELAQLVNEPDAATEILRDPARFTSWAWPLFTGIQGDLLGLGLLDAVAVANPLSTQMDIEYWRYETLFA